MARSSPLLLILLGLWLQLANAMDNSSRCVMYLTGQHNVVPKDKDLRQDVTHVILAFLRSDLFNTDQDLGEYSLFTSVDAVRTEFPSSTKVMVAVGGWGDSLGFEEAARSQTTRERWAKRVREMVEATGADGVDIDWEYPGGNRDDYKTVPNGQRVWEIEAFHLLLAALRKEIGAEKQLSIAVPGKEQDLMAFTDETIPRIVDQVDFINIMTYDLMNRRDTIVKHHSGVEDSKQSIQRYLDRGVPSGMVNLGLGYYIKWFMTEDCDYSQPIDCPTQLLEDPVTGDDLGRTAAFSWHDEVPPDLADSFSRAISSPQYFEDGSVGFWDASERRWWSYDTDRSIRQKIRDIVGPMSLGGVFAWGLGEDAPNFTLLTATVESLRDMTENGVEPEAHDEL
ncbi:hypothetical protein K4F52_006178 [Lecanicillium sp. MT-2017a]|nr:hypothetical protein K4F52_006178 [Lecanicillium sp. MT-2017a]